MARVSSSTSADLVASSAMRVASSALRAAASARKSSISAMSCNNIIFIIRSIERVAGESATSSTSIASMSSRVAID